MASRFDARDSGIGATTVTYRAGDGMNRNTLGFELPRLGSVLQAAGTYDAPSRNLVFRPLVELVETTQVSTSSTNGGRRGQPAAGAPRSAVADVGMRRRCQASRMCRFMHSCASSARPAAIAAKTASCSASVV